MRVCEGVRVGRETHSQPQFLKGFDGVEGRVGVAPLDLHCILVLHQLGSQEMG